MSDAPPLASLSAEAAEPRLGSDDDGAAAAAPDAAPAAPWQRQQPLATPRELQGWYAFAFASEPISAVAISGFFPLLVQELALAAAGFPGVCPNLAPPALAAATFGANATAFFFAGVEAAFLPSAACVPVALGNGSGSSVLCPGLPANAEECLTAAGRAAQLYPLRTPPVAGLAWEPTAYATMLVSLATALQLVLFTALGSLADYGALRFRILQALTALCAGLALLALAVGPADFQGAGCLFVLLGVAYGSTFVQYNGFLPLLAANDPGVRALAPGPGREAALHAALNRISSHGYGWGYIGAVIVLVACVGITLGAGSAVAAYRASVALAGAWLAALGWLPFCAMRVRPGPPLPRGGGGGARCSLPWGEVLATLRTAHKLPNTFALLACWFFYADGMNLIGNIGAQYANQYVDWRPLPKGLGLAGMLLLVPIFAAAGNFFWPWVEARYQWRAWQVICANCLLCACVPAYGLLGLLSPSLGFRRHYDMLLGVALYGLQVGSIQSYSRAAYGAMVPRGQEARFYGLWSFVDKGSSWVGPAVVSIILQATGSVRLGFAFPLAVLLPPCAVLGCIDYRKGAEDARAFAEAWAREREGGGGRAGAGGEGGAAEAPEAPLRAALQAREEK